MPPMMALQMDFTSGELSPFLSSRVDMAQYGKGCRTLRNFLVQPFGPAVKRPGFVLLGGLPEEAALIEFVFNESQAYCLVFGEGWMRVATHDGFVLGSNGRPYQIVSPYTLEQAKRLSHAQSADVIFLACRGVPPQKLMRYDHDDWRFQPMSFDAPLAAPDGLSVEFVNGAKKSDGSSSAAQLVTPYTYHVTAVDADGGESGLSAGADITGPASNNWQAGDYITLSWKAVDGATEYRVYKGEFGGTPGYVATTGAANWRDYNVAASLSEGPPTYVNPFVLPDDIQDWPGVVCLFEQRLVFAGTQRRPQTIWMSKSGDYSNFATYTPLSADSPVELTLAGQEVSEILWMVPLRSLILGSTGMEWEVSGQGDNAFSATNAHASPQSYWGSSLRRALIAGNVVLHVAASGSQVRNLQYDFGSDSYGGMDLSILAQHLFQGHKLTDWAYQKSPDSIVWAVRDDGVLLGLTFQSEHQIASWHRHDTQGKFVSVCAVPYGGSHDLFVCTLRNGSHFLERMGDRYYEGNPARFVWLDCALTYEGPEARELAGLEHLEGMTVGIFSQGAVEAPRKVEEGKIRLNRPSTLVTVGLTYTADLETMPVEMAGQGGASVGLKKQISTINPTFHESLSAKMGLSTDPGNFDGVKWQDIRWRTNEPYGMPPAPFTGVKHLTMPNLAETVMSICLRSESPTPLTIQSIMSRIQVYQ